jgi:hypothetical protein
MPECLCMRVETCIYIAPCAEGAFKVSASLKSESNCEKNFTTTISPEKRQIKLTRILLLTKCNLAPVDSGQSSKCRGWINVYNTAAMYKWNRHWTKSTATPAVQKRKNFSEFLCERQTIHSYLMRRSLRSGGSGDSCSCSCSSL